MVDARPINYQNMTKDNAYQDIGFIAVHQTVDFRIKMETATYSPIEEAEFLPVVGVGTKSTSTLILEIIVFPKCM